MTEELWKNWDAEKHYGELFYRRATGMEPEMESSKAAARMVKKHYAPGDSLLDVGCGAGHYLRSLKAGVDVKINYTGVDPTEYYIELAKKAYTEKVKFKVGNIFELPFADQNFDIVMCNNVVMHLPPEKLQQAFDELVRVSRKTVLIRAMVGVRNYIVKEILTVNDLTPGNHESIEYTDFDLTHHRYRYFNMYTLEYYEQLLKTNNKDLFIEIIEDKDWKEFSNIEAAKIDTATKSLSNLQVSGNIILDWRWIVVGK